MRIVLLWENSMSSSKLLSTAQGEISALFEKHASILAELQMRCTHPEVYSIDNHVELVVLGMFPPSSYRICPGCGKETDHYGDKFPTLGSYPGIVEVSTEVFVAVRKKFAPLVSTETA